MGGRDHSCEVCGHGGFNDPGGTCICPDSCPERASLVTPEAVEALRDAEWMRSCSPSGPSEDSPEWARMRLEMVEPHLLNAFKERLDALPRHAIAGYGEWFSIPEVYALFSTLEASDGE